MFGGIRDSWWGLLGWLLRGWLRFLRWRRFRWWGRGLYRSFFRSSISDVPASFPKGPGHCAIPHSPGIVSLVGTADPAGHYYRQDIRRKSPLAALPWTNRRR